MKNKNNGTKQHRRFLALVVLGLLLSMTGCQAASNLFNPDTYSFDYNKEPWEKNIKRSKPAKNNSISSDY